MKRSPALIQLSREHHPALKLAKRAQRLAGQPDEDQVGFMAGAVEIFNREMEPHFQTEEADLLPRLEKAGFIELVRRTLDEHAEIRALIGRLAANDTTSLKRFGDLLEAHVRFEERELFAAAELLLASGTQTPFPLSTQQGN
ncbi:MAG: hemerythrin domain-containing protein [Betaproteobacteria bacterium]